MSRGHPLIPFESGLGRRGDPWADMWSGLDSPSRIVEQFFGTTLPDDDLFRPIPWRGWYVRPRRQVSVPETSGASEVAVTDKDFKVNLDVSHFKPGEITIKTVDNRVVVHGKHEERPDEHGFIQREFKRSYPLPEDVKAELVTSSLSADGILSIVGPRHRPELEANERVVSIQMVPAAGLPAGDKA